MRLEHDMKIKTKINADLLIFFLAVLSVTLISCSLNSSSPSPEVDKKLQVVTTTTFVGDVVGIIGGEAIDLTVLLEPGQNPHSYQPVPQDMVKVSKADLIFANGLGLEDFLDDLLGGTGKADELVIVSEQIIPLEGLDPGHEGDDEGQAHDQDPHVWFDPNNVLSWTEIITDTLVENDPEHAEIYLENAAQYREELKGLDSWIQEQVANIPEENRKLVTDHTVFGYFIEQYGFTQVGAVIPALTTEAETSGQQLSSLIDIIRENNVKAIFIGVDFDPSLSDMIAYDTGAELVPLYFGSLSQGAPAESYLTFMQYNVETIVNALQ